MDIKHRLKAIKNIIDNDISLKRFIELTQKEPNSNIYTARDKYKNVIKEYEIDNIDLFYENNTNKNTHILRVDIVDNSHLEKYLYMADEEG